MFDGKDKTIYKTNFIVINTADPYLFLACDSARCTQTFRNWIQVADPLKLSIGVYSEESKEALN